jgi:hypothetical protein
VQVFFPEMTFFLSFFFFMKFLFFSLQLRLPFLPANFSFIQDQAKQRLSAAHLAAHSSHVSTLYVLGLPTLLFAKMTSTIGHSGRLGGCVGGREVGGFPEKGKNHSYVQNKRVGVKSNGGGGHQK